MMITMNAIAAATQQATAMTVDNVQPAQEKINMNAIVNMYKNTSDMSALRNEGYGSADFEIDEQVLHYISPHHGHKHSTKKVIFRQDTGSQLGVHGLDYHTVDPKEMIDTTRAIIERSDLDTTGIEENIQTSHNGSRTFVQYRLPAHSYMTPDGDTASLGLLAVSSFDGSWPFMISAAAIQQACTNLQVFVSGEVAVFKAKHTKHLNIEAGARVITKALDIFHNENELWKLYTETPTNDNQAFEKIVNGLNINSAKALIESKGSFYAPSEIMNLMPRKSSSLEYIYSAWLRYRSRLGSNKWALYNAFTDWSTHAEGKTQAAQLNIASTQFKRQEKVQDIFKKAA